MRFYLIPLLGVIYHRYLNVFKFMPRIYIIPNLFKFFILYIDIDSAS